MKVSDLIFADYAAANEHGKFTLVGAGFNEIFAKKIPCIHPAMFILIRLKISIQDIGKNKVEIRLIGEKGSIFKADCDIDVSDDHKQDQHLALPMHLQNLKFEAAGEYICEVRINGKPEGNEPLRIRLQEPQPAS